MVKNSFLMLAAFSLKFIARLFLSLEQRSRIKAWILEQYSFPHSKVEVDRVIPPENIFRSDNALGASQTASNQWKEEIQRISEPLLKNIKRPFIMIEDGLDLEGELRLLLQVPGPQHFMIGSCQMPLPTHGTDIRLLESYLLKRCPNLHQGIRGSLLKCLTQLFLKNEAEWINAARLLSLAPTDDIVYSQYDWYRLHCPIGILEEENQMGCLIEESLEDGALALTSLFLAFNFRMFIVSMVSHRINGDRYGQAKTHSPFTYMMV